MIRTRGIRLWKNGSLVLESSHVPGRFLWMEQRSKKTEGDVKEKFGKVEEERTEMDLKVRKYSEKRVRFKHPMTKNVGRKQREELVNLSSSQEMAIVEEQLTAIARHTNEVERGILYAQFLERLIFGRRVRAMMLALDHMMNKEVATVMHCNMVLGTLAQFKFVTYMEHVGWLMKTHGVPFNRRTYRKFLAQYATRGQVECALYVFNDLLSSNENIETEDYNFLIQTYFRNSDAEGAKKWYAQ